MNTLPRLSLARTHLVKGQRETVEIPNHTSASPIQILLPKTCRITTRGGAAPTGTITSLES